MVVPFAQSSQDGWLCSQPSSALILCKPPEYPVVASPTF